MKLSEGISWKNEYDGGELALYGIENLTIRGLVESGNVEIVVEPRYVSVITFDNCSNIVIEHLTAGHVAF